MAAVNHGELPAGGDLGQHRGDEVLLAQVRPDGPADFARHLVQRGHGGRAAPERAQHVPGQQAASRPLAADVPDDDPDAVRGGNDVIQIPAGTGSGCRRAVAGRDADPGDLRGQRRELDARALRSSGEARLRRRCAPASTTASTLTPQAAASPIR